MKLKLLLSVMLVWRVDRYFCRPKFVAIAATYYVRKVFVSRSEIFDIFVFGEKTLKLDEFLVEVMKRNKAPVKLFHFTGKENVTIYRSAIFLFDKESSYHEFHWQRLSKEVQLSSLCQRRHQSLFWIKTDDCQRIFPDRTREHRRLDDSPAFSTAKLS